MDAVTATHVRAEKASMYDAVYVSISLTSAKLELLFLIYTDLIP